MSESRTGSKVTGNGLLAPLINNINNDGQGGERKSEEPALALAVPVPVPYCMAVVPMSLEGEINQGTLESLRNQGVFRPGSTSYVEQKPKDKRGREGGYRVIGGAIVGKTLLPNLMMPILPLILTQEIPYEARCAIGLVFSVYFGLDLFRGVYNRNTETQNKQLMELGLRAECGRGDELSDVLTTSASEYALAATSIGTTAATLALSTMVPGAYKDMGYGFATVTALAGAGIELQLAKRKNERVNRAQLKQGVERIEARSAEASNQQVMLNMGIIILVFVGWTAQDRSGVKSDACTAVAGVCALQLLSRIADSYRPSRGGCVVGPRYRVGCPEHLNQLIGREWGLHYDMGGLPRDYIDHALRIFTGGLIYLAINLFVEGDAPGMVSAVVMTTVAAACGTLYQVRSNVDASEANNSGSYPSAEDLEAGGGSTALTTPSAPPPAAGGGAVQQKGVNQK
jgi:hypothetical protein